MNIEDGICIIEVNIIFESYCYNLPGLGITERYSSLCIIRAVTFVLSATLPKQKRYWRRNARNTSPPIGNGKPNRQ